MKALYFFYLIWVITGISYVFGSPLPQLDGLLDGNIPTTIAAAREAHPNHAAEPTAYHTEQQIPPAAVGSLHPAPTIIPGYPGYPVTSGFLGQFRPTLSVHPGLTSGSILAVPTGYRTAGSSSSGSSHSLFSPTAKPTADSPTPSSSSSDPPPSPSSGSSSTLNRWKIIGIGVISFGVVIALLILSISFDNWFRFLKDLFSGWRSKKGSGKRGGADGSFEELVPDWEKASWEIRVDQRDRERYPSFSSLPNGLSRSASSRKAERSGTSPNPHANPANSNANAYADTGMGWTGVGTTGGQTYAYPQTPGGSNNVEKEMDVTTYSQKNAGWVYYVPPKAILENSEVPSIPAVPSNRTPSRSRSRRDNDGRGEDPFQDPKPSTAHQSVYGGIAD